MIKSTTSILSHEKMLLAATFLRGLQEFTTMPEFDIAIATMHKCHAVLQRKYSRYEVP